MSRLAARRWRRKEESSKEYRLEVYGERRKSGPKRSCKELNTMLKRGAQISKGLYYIFQRNCVSEKVKYLKVPGIKA